MTNAPYTTADLLAFHRRQYRTVRAACADQFLSAAHFDLRAHECFRKNEYVEAGKPTTAAHWVTGAYMAARSVGIDPFAVVSDAFSAEIVEALAA